MSADAAYVTLPPVHVPDDQSRLRVARMAAMQLTTEQAAVILGCTPSELALHYALEWEHGLALVTEQVASALVTNALAGDTQAQKYWLEVRAKWRAPVVVEHKTLLDAEQKRALIDSLIGLVNVSPGAEGQEPKSPATHLPAPGRSQ